MDELQEEIDSYGVNKLMLWLDMLQKKAIKIQAEMYMMPYDQELHNFTSDRMATNQMIINKITARLSKLRCEEIK